MQEVFELKAQVSLNDEITLFSEWSLNRVGQTRCSNNFSSLIIFKMNVTWLSYCLNSRLRGMKFSSTLPNGFIGVFTTMAFVFVLNAACRVWRSNIQSSLLDELSFWIREKKYACTFFFRWVLNTLVACTLSTLFQCAYTNLI